MSSKSSVGGVLVVLGWAAVLAKSATAQFVPVRELDTNGLIDNDFAVRLEGGFVAGSGTAGASNVPVVFDPSGTTLLPLPVGLDAGFARGCDAAGTVVGSGHDSSTFSGFTALLWQGGAVVDVNTLVTGGGPAVLTSANDLDEKGHLIVDGVLGSGATRGFLLDLGVLVDLAALDPSFAGGDTSALAMNERLVVVGVANGHACVFENGKLIDLDDPTVMKGLSQANGVNRDGWVVGFSGPSIFFAPQAFMWDRTKVVELATSPPSNSIANAINDFGVVVGTWLEPTSSSWHACAWVDVAGGAGGTFVDLNALIDPSLGWVLTDATDVDEAGRICGIGFLNGVQSAFQLEPDCLGSFTTYGAGCPGTGAVEPQLRGAGCPAPDRDFALEIVDGLRNAFGLVLIGTGQGVVTVKPGCDLQVLPVLPPALPFVLDGLGTTWSPIRLPTGTPVFDLNLQAFVADPGAAHKLAATKPLALHFE